MATVKTVSIVEQRRPQKYALAATAGAIAGGVAKYVMPNQKELSMKLNKENIDTFVSSAATKARGESRSTLKYVGLGALVALGAKAVKNYFSPKEKLVKTSDVQYSKYDALLDAPDYSCMVLWYGDDKNA